VPRLRQSLPLLLLMLLHVAAVGWLVVVAGRGNELR
jgi:hypothetical protein